MQLRILNKQKRCKWTKEMLNTQKEGENFFFSIMFQVFGIGGPLGAELHCL